MGLTTFALANLFFSFTARDKLRSVFSLDTFNDRKFLITTRDVDRGDRVRDRDPVLPAAPGHAVAHRRAVVDLHRRQPRVVVVSEVWKFVLRRKEV